MRGCSWGLLERVERNAASSTTGTIPTHPKLCEHLRIARKRSTKNRKKVYHLLAVGGMVRKKLRVAHLPAPKARRGQPLFHAGEDWGLD